MLKFCYLCLVVFAISCATESKKVQQAENEDAVPTKTEVEKKQRIILFFGNSLTAGMGLEIEEAFPALIQKKIDSMSVDFKVINAGLSGETTASGKNRLSYGI